MSTDRPADHLSSLVHELCALPLQTEWVEFKVNEAEPLAIGEYISALANSAALVGKAFAYLVWGVRACYLHACLRYVTRQPMTNASLRQRLGIDDKNIATVSRLLGEAVEAGLIVVADPEVGTRIRSYLPFWAAPRPDPREVA